MRLKPVGWAGSLAAVALAGLLIRLYAINFGLPGLYDPDELMFELGAIRMLSHGTLNPGWFGHPATTTMYGLAIVNMATFGFGHLMGWFPTLKSFGVAVYTNPAWMILPGRVLMAVFGAGTVWQTGRLGREISDGRVGLIAAALVALSPLCVAWGQVIRSDIMGSFFVLLALRGVLRADLRPGWRADAVVAGWLGVAVATKWPMGLAALGMGAMMLRWAWRERVGVAALAIRMGRFGAMMVGFTLLTSPYLLLAHDTVLRNLRGEAQMHHLGATGGTPLHNLDWYLTGPLAQGLSWPGLLLAGAGMLLICRQADRRAAWLLLPVIGGLGVVICAQRLVWDRWVLPLVPLLAVLAAFALVGLVDRWGARSGRWGARASVVPGMLALGVLTLAVPMGITVAAQARGRMNDTRQRASAWAVAHIPAGASVMIEHFGFDLYPQPWQILFPLGDAGCVDVRALLQGRIGYDVIDRARGDRSNIDYGTLAPDKRETCMTGFAIITQYDRYRAEARDFPAEERAYALLLSHGHEVASFFPEWGRSSGPIVRIFAFSSAQDGNQKPAS
jgi:hypothetical protein